MKKISYIIIAFACVVMQACNKDAKKGDAGVDETPSSEVSATGHELDVVNGQRVLAQARSLCQSGRLDEARDSIMSLRTNYPYAIDARRQAILLLDSVELFAATDSLATLEQTHSQQSVPNYGAEHERLDMKVQFFMHKLQNDQQKRNER
ncbi:MAG: hypothetical protein KBT39_11785 [Bacteroidales bacterium]|nr:hypothetical protein [Bacteroidales bacterium]